MKTDFDSLMREAGNRVRSMDAIDRSLGRATMSDVGTFETLRIAKAALEAGLRRRDWSCAADAFLYLGSAVSELEKRLCVNEKPPQSDSG